MTDYSVPKVYEGINCRSVRYSDNNDYYNLLNYIMYRVARGKCLDIRYSFKLLYHICRVYDLEYWNKVATAMEKEGNFGMIFSDHYHDLNNRFVMRSPPLYCLLREETKKINKRLVP